MTRTVGHQDRTEIILDPAEAWRRGRLLDRMLAKTLPSPPRGVRRGTHAMFNALDDEWHIEIARRVNTPRPR